ncbi:hypothetical protein KK103_17775, partial [Curtobacterium flaccumfaciens pv. flaccumfaciens]
PTSHAPHPTEGTTTVKTVIVLVVIWAVLSIVGFALKGLLWLGIIGIVLLLGTIVFGAVRRSGNKARNAGRTN